jgi:hypothetical protein
MFRWKKALLLIILLAVLLVVFQMKPSPMGETEALVAMIRTAGARVVEGEVQFYAILDEKFRTMEELEETLLDVADLLGIQEGEVLRGEGETYRVLDINGQTAFGPTAQLVVQSNPGNEEAGFGPQTYLLLICRDTSADDLEAMIERIDGLMMPLAPQGQISFYLTGERPGQLSYSEMDRLAHQALRAVRGKVVEEMKNEDIISLTGYTELVDRYVEADGERFNLNLAIRYDDYHDKTILWAGFPLIHGSY